jgi:hypothetical protein
MRRSYALVLWAGLALSLCCGVESASGQGFQSVFSKQYTRAQGAPVTASDVFAPCDPSGTFRMVVVNGPAGQDQIGTDPISSGSIFVNGFEVVREQDFKQHTTLIERSLSGIGPSNQIDVRIRSGPGGAIRVTVEAIQNCGIRITSPPRGSTLTDSIVVVRGTAPAPRPGAEVGVSVNGVAALVAGDQFAALVPADPQLTSLTAVATDGTTTLSSDTISVTVQLADPDRPPLTFRAKPAGGLVPLIVNFSIASDVLISQVALDVDGNGTVDFQGPTLENQRFTYVGPGFFLPSVTVTDGTGATRTATTLVRVYDAATLDALLQAKWRGLKDALRAGDIARALTFIAGGKRAVYGPIFSGLGSRLATIDQILTDITFVDHVGIQSEYQMIRVDDGSRLSYFVLFVLDEDGIWRLASF